MFVGGIHAEFPVIFDTLDFVCRYLPLPFLKHVFRFRKYIWDYATRAIDNSKNQDDNTKNIFSTIIAESQKEDALLTDRQVKFEAGNLIVAGSDTTAVTLTYLIWAVLKNRDLQQDLEGEVKAVKEGFTDTDLEALPLLNATIEEALRLYGAAPSSLPRQTPPNGATLCGYKLPGSITVCTQAYTIHRDPALYSDPEKCISPSTTFLFSSANEKPPGSIPLASSTQKSSRQTLQQHSMLSAPAQGSVLGFTLRGQS